MGGEYEYCRNRLVFVRRGTAGPVLDINREEELKKRSRMVRKMVENIVDLDPTGSCLS